MEKICRFAYPFMKSKTNKPHGSPTKLNVLLGILVHKFECGSSSERSFWQVQSLKSSWSRRYHRLSFPFFLNIFAIQFYNLFISQFCKGKYNLFAESASEERNARRTVLESSLREVMFQIIKFVNEKKDHIPAIPNLECVTFPYDFSISR